MRRRVDVPIAADESIRRAEDPYRVRDLEAADVAVLKVQPLGGVRACLRIAEDIGLPVVVSSALETSVGIAAGVALAAALPELPHACGLATVQLLTADVAARAAAARWTASCPSCDPEVDPVRLAAVAAAPDRRRALGGAAGADPAGSDARDPDLRRTAATAATPRPRGRCRRAGPRRRPPRGALPRARARRALAFAAHDAAARAAGSTLHTRIDERTAGFLALGLARTSRRRWPW